MSNHYSSRSILHMIDTMHPKIFVGRTKYDLEFKDLELDLNGMLQKYNIVVPNSSVIEIRQGENVLRKYFKSKHGIKQLFVTKVKNIVNAHDIDRSNNILTRLGMN